MRDVGQRQLLLQDVRAETIHLPDRFDRRIDQLLRPTTVGRTYVLPLSFFDSQTIRPSGGPSKVHEEFGPRQNS